MNADRKLQVIVCAQHAAKLALTLAMDAARFAETESSVHGFSATLGIAQIRREIDLLEAALKGDAEPVALAARAA
jgi:hypothetical protein